MNSPDPSADSSKWNKPFIAACLLGFLMAAVASLRLIKLAGVDSAEIQKRMAEERQKTEDVMRQRAESERQKRIKAAKESVIRMAADSHARMEEIVKEARAKTSKILSSLDAQVPNLTSQVNGKLQGYGNAVGLVRRMAEDKVRGTRKTQDYLQDAFQPVVQAHAQTEAELRQVLKDCSYALQTEAAKLQAGTANLLGSQGFKEADLGADSALKSLFTEVTPQAFQAAINSTVATLEVAIEAVLIKTTFETLSKLLAKAVAKEAGSLAIGAGGATIPGVDIITTAIAVVGTAWTAYDVYAAVDEMKKVEPTIRAGLDDSVHTLEGKSELAFKGLEQTIATMFASN